MNTPGEREAFASRIRRVVEAARARGLRVTGYELCPDDHLVLLTVPAEKKRKPPPEPAPVPAGGRRRVSRGSQHQLL